MDNQLDELIRNYLNTPHEMHRTVIAKFKKKAIDASDFAWHLENELGFKPDMQKIAAFSGYNPKKEIDALIYNYDKRGWLYLEIPTKELFFIEASKYPYPQKLIEKRMLAERLKNICVAVGFFLAATLIITLAAVLFF